MTPDEEFQQFKEFEQYQAFKNRPTSVSAREEGITGTEALQAVGQGALQGATFGFSDEMAGGIEAVPRYLGAMGGEEKYDSLKAAYEAGRDESRQKYAKAQEMAPVITAASEMVGGGAGGYGLAKMVGVPKSLAGASALGASEGALLAAGKSTDAEDFMRKAMQDIPLGTLLGTTGYGVGELYNRIKQPNLSPLTQRQAQADRLGIELTPAERYGDDTLHQFEQSRRSDPGYGRPFLEIDARNQDRANRIAAETIGLQGVDKLTEVEMGQAARDISQRFKDATSTGDIIHFDQDWVTDLKDINKAYRKIWGKSGANPKMMKDVIETTKTGSITPDEYQRRYSALGKDLEKARKAGDMHKMELYGGLRDALDNLVDRNADGLSDQFKDARRLYKNKMLLQKKGVVRTETGNVSPKVLANNLQNDVKGYLEGADHSDLYDLARVVKGTDAGISNSNTATRSKTLVDYLTGPIKTPVSRAYLTHGKFQNMMGPSTGEGGYLMPYMGAPLQSPNLIDAFEEEDR